MKDHILDFILAFIFGILLGVVFAWITLQPKKLDKDCLDGWYEEIENGVRVKTYMPALDTCKEER